MSYRSVDSEAYKKAYAKHGIKNKKKKSKAKKVLKDEKGTFEWELTGPRHRRKKKYLTNFSDAQPKAKKDMTSNKAYPLSFGETFKQSKAKGEKTFRWKNKQFHTKTKDELEKAAKERSERYAKAKKESIPKETTPEKKGFFSKIKSILGGDKDRSPEAVEKRRMKKRVAWMKKRKADGKSYSAKNLKELEAKLN